MTTLHIPPPAVPVEVTAEQVVAYLLRPGSGWVEMTALSSPHYIEFELRPRAHDQNDGACGVPREACKRPIPNMMEAIDDIARAEHRHPLAVAEEIAGPARAASVGVACRGDEDRASILARARCRVKMSLAHSQAERAEQEAKRAEREALLGHTETVDNDSAAHGAGESEK